MAHHCMKDICLEMPSWYFLSRNLHLCGNNCEQRDKRKIILNYDGTDARRKAVRLLFLFWQCSLNYDEVDFKGVVAEYPPPPPPHPGGWGGGGGVSYSVTTSQDNLFFLLLGGD